jgi:hypothetical protein
VFLRRSCMFLRRRGAPFGPPHRVSHKCYAFPRRSCGVSAEKLRVSTEKMRVSTEKLHISTEKRLSVTEQRQCSTEKFNFHGITTHLYGEGASFYGEVLARMGHRTLLITRNINTTPDLPFRAITFIIKSLV